MVVEVIMVGRESKTGVDEVVDVDGEVVVMGRERCGIGEGEGDGWIVKVKVVKVVVGVGRLYVMDERV